MAAGVPIPANDIWRLEALRSLNLLDTGWFPQTQKEKQKNEERQSVASLPGTPINNRQCYAFACKQQRKAERLAPREEVR
jgi:hypothetical protein